MNGSLCDPAQVGFDMLPRQLSRRPKQGAKARDVFNIGFRLRLSRRMKGVKAYDLVKIDTIEQMILST
jgi:hypothetical protein